MSQIGVQDHCYLSDKGIKTESVTDLLEFLSFDFNELSPKDYYNTNCTWLFKSIH